MDPRPTAWRRSHRSTPPGPLGRPAYGDHQAEQAADVRGAVPVPALRQPHRTAAGHRRGVRRVRDAACVDCRATDRRVVARSPRRGGSRTQAPAKRLPTGGGTHPRTLRPRGGDVQFSASPHTVLVGPTLGEVVDFFGFREWPADSVTFDLGGRRLRAIGLPGHQEASIAVHDPWTGFLLTGDSVYPGRLYVTDMAAFVDSLDRLVTLAEQHPVSAVLGCHIEMASAPGVDYPIGTRYQPAEPPLDMTVDQLRQGARRCPRSRVAAWRARLRRLHHLQRPLCDRRRPPTRPGVVQPGPRASSETVSLWVDHRRVPDRTSMLSWWARARTDSSPP